MKLSQRSRDVVESAAVYAICGAAGGLVFPPVLYLLFEFGRAIGRAMRNQGLWDVWGMIVAGGIVIGAFVGVLIAIVMTRKDDRVGE